MRSQTALILIVGAVLVFHGENTPFAGQRIIYVDDDAAGADNGSSWDNAYRYLQDALAAAGKAEKPVEIRIAQGIYRPDQSRAGIPSTRSPRHSPSATRRDTMFVAGFGTTLAGGYAGPGAADPNAWNPTSYRTILSGDLDGNDEPGIRPCDLPVHPSRQDNAYTVVLMGRVGIVGAIRGLQIEGANETALMFSSPGSAWPELVVSDCIFRYNCGYDGGAVKIDRENVTLLRCTFTENWAERGGAIAVNACSTTIRNSILAGNSAGQCGGAILSCQPVAITICTFHENSAPEGNAMALVDGAVCKADSRLTVTNCILRDGGNEISNQGMPRLDVMYCNIQGGWPGAQILDADPCFAAPGRWDTKNTPDPNDDTWIEGDYHLKSRTGRWDPAAGKWVQDAASSPCIDAGDVYSSYANEPWPHGLRANLGAYADTPEASLSLSPSGSMADLNRDGIVDVEDLARLVDRWLDEGTCIAEDLNRDENVDLPDFGILASEWLAERTEVRFAEYWPLLPGNRWDNLPIIWDWGCTKEVTDRFAANGFDVRVVQYNAGGWRSSSSSTRYRVYVNGALYGTFDKSALDRLPDVSNGFTREWPEVVQIGQPFLDDAGYPLTPVHMTFRQLAARFDDEFPLSILTLYPPEDRDLDVLAFTTAGGAVIHAFGRGYGPILDGGIWMTRTPSYRWRP